jgi:hypothetical protein
MPVSESRCLIIRSEDDLIHARLQTRLLAKLAGLSTVDQARISLAVSSLAHIIGMGDTYPGQIILNRIDNHERSGVQVIWQLGPHCDIEAVQNNLDNSTIFMMVHELESKMCKENGISITARVWIPLPVKV